MTPMELRAMMAAQLMAAVMDRVPPNAAETTIREVVEHVVKVAKAIEEAVGRSGR
jgi:hypothetical protein